MNDATAQAQPESFLMEMIDARVTRYTRYLNGARHGTEARANVERKLASATRARDELIELLESARAGHPMRGAGDGEPGLWLNPAKAVRLRAALAPIRNVKAGGR